MPNPSTPRETLYLIDGHAQIFRAYYAIRGGLNSPVTGEPTQAVFGFAGMMIKLFATFSPHYVVMAVDSKGKTFRDELFAQYKANRSAPPADLDAQIPRILELTRLFGVPVLAQVGAEADDIIATVVRRILDDPRHEGVDIRVVSKDKDLEQLLGDRVTMFDIQTDTTIDAAWLKANKGISPQQVVDMLALTGDTADNIPGCPGIGPKTAAALIQEFGSIEGIWANLDKIKGKRRENLEASREGLALSRRLVTLKDDLAIDLDLDHARVRSIDSAALRRLFHELGFTRHMNDLERLLGRSQAEGTRQVELTEATSGGLWGDSGRVSAGTSGGTLAGASGGGFADNLFEAAAPAEVSVRDGALPEVSRTPGITTAADFDYQGITTRRQLDDLVETIRGLKAKQIIAIDTETIGLGHRAKVCGISFAWKPGHGVYVPLVSPEPANHLDAQTSLAALKPLLEDPGIRKTGHNLKYDILVLRNAGIRVRGVAFDSMIASHLLGLPGHGLDTLALAQLKHEMIPITGLIGLDQKGNASRTMDQAPLALIVPYAAGDADVSLRLYELFAPQLRAMGMEPFAGDVEMPLVEVLAEMEFNGFRIDPEELQRQQQVLAGRAAELRRQIQDQANCGEFNPDSPKQLADVLFKRLNLPVVKRSKTGPSTDIEVLEKLAELEGIEPRCAAVVGMIVEYRQLTKLVNTYLEALRQAINEQTGRVHATFHQASTATGRLSSSGPNLQNIPIRTDLGRQVRKAFLAEPGHLLISADYSQIELRVLAHLSQDPALVEAFRKDMDIHTAVAAEVFGVPADAVTREQRAQAKIINFGIVYGVSPYGLVRRIEGLDIEGAKKLIADYKQRYTGVEAFLQRCIQQAMNLGYVTTMHNRRRAIPEITSPNGATQSLGQRLAINTVVQGSAAELIKKAMVNLHRRILDENLPMKLLLQIHDELVFEALADDAPRMEAIVRREMESAIELRVPLKVDAAIGADWYEAK